MAACRLRAFALFLLLLCPPPPPLPPGCMGHTSGGGAMAGTGNVYLEAPQTVLRNGSLDLRCHFKPLDGKLYSIKWYKESNEFFHVAPGDAKPMRTYPVVGVHVDEDASNATHVHLHSVGPQTSGNFICEVTEDAPHFNVFMDLKTVQVVEVDPSHLPKVTGLKKQYRPGEWIRTNCTGPWSKPQVKLHWQVNGQPVAADSVHSAGPEARQDGLRRPTLQLRLPVPRAPTTSTLRLRCTAQLHDVYHKVVEKTVNVQKASEKSVGDSEVKEFSPENSSAVYPHPPVCSSLLPMIFVLILLLPHC